jgi:hypothetical protein
MTSYEYLNKIIEILDDALNNLSPDAFRRLLDNIGGIVDDYE